MTSTLIDGLLIMLLLYGIRIAKDFHAKYEEFKQLKTDLKGILRQVQTSMKNASETVETLQTSIQFASTHITPSLPKANTLRDDLQFLLDRGESVANRLERLGSDMKDRYLSPHHVAFDPEKDTLEPQKESSTPTKEEIDENLNVERKGFFTSIRRVR